MRAVASDQHKGAAFLLSGADAGFMQTASNMAHRHSGESDDRRDWENRNLNRPTSHVPTAPTRQDDEVSFIAASRKSEDSIPPWECGTRVTAQRNLQWWDVSSLIINKMVGTGIFSGPYAVMAATGNKSLTLSYWIIGFIYTILSMWMYLEYARQLPYTGGELVYLDFVWGGMRLIAYTAYAFYFVTFYTTCTNSLNFAKQVLIAVDVRADPADQDRGLLVYIAFTITCFVCLLLYFSSAKSRLLNAITAFAKVLLLAAVLIAGCVYKVKVGKTDMAWGDTIPIQPELGWSQGLLGVFFSFHGWENATLISGEIPKYRVLRNGFVAAVLVVGAFYVAIVAVFCASFSPTLNVVDSTNYMALFFGNTDRAREAAAILTSLSAVGSMISVAYTAVRVKQIIGWTNILPLSNLWRRTDISRRIRALLPRSGRDPWSAAVNQAVAIRKGTPEGGVILHFIFSLLILCLTLAIPKNKNPIGYFSNVLIYGHFIFEAAVGVGFAFYFKPGTVGNRDVEWDAPEPPEWFIRKRLGFMLLGGSTVVMSLFVLILELVKPLGRWYLLTNGVVLFAGATYWLCFAYCRAGSHNYSFLGLTITTQVHGRDDVNNALRQCSLCARQPGLLHRHREDGYLNYNMVMFSNSKLGKRMNKWFGGFDETEELHVVSEQAMAAATDLPMRRVKRAHANTVEHGEASSATTSSITDRERSL